MSDGSSLDGSLGRLAETEYDGDDVASPKGAPVRERLPNQEDFAAASPIESPAYTDLSAASPDPGGDAASASPPSSPAYSSAGSPLSPGAGDDRSSRSRSRSPSLSASRRSQSSGSDAASSRTLSSQSASPSQSPASAPRGAVDAAESSASPTTASPTAASASSASPACPPETGIEASDAERSATPSPTVSDGGSGDADDGDGDGNGDAEEREDRETATASPSCTSAPRAAEEAQSTPHSQSSQVSSRSKLPVSLMYSPYSYADKLPMSWDDRRKPVAQAQLMDQPKKGQRRLTELPPSGGNITLDQNRQLRQLILDRSPLLHSRPIRMLPDASKLLHREKVLQKKYVAMAEKTRAAPADPLLHAPAPGVRTLKQRKGAAGEDAGASPKARSDSDAQLARAMKGIGAGTLPPPPGKGALKLSLPSRKPPVPVTNTLGELVDTLDADKLYHEDRHPPGGKAAPFSSAERKIAFPGQATQCSPGPVYNVKSDWTTGTATQRPPHRGMPTFVVQPGPGEYAVERADRLTKPKGAKMGTIPGDRKHAKGARLFAGQTLPVSVHLGSYAPDKIRRAPHTHHGKVVRKLESIQHVTDGNMRQGISAGDAFRSNAPEAAAKVDKDDAKLLAMWERACMEDAPYLTPNPHLQRAVS